MVLGGIELIEDLPFFDHPEFLSGNLFDILLLILKPFHLLPQFSVLLFDVLVRLLDSNQLFLEAKEMKNPFVSPKGQKAQHQKEEKH
jgi:hypothetical protein